MRIAVLTCDKYNWLIPYFWHFFKKYFPDNPYPVDFVTETEHIYFGNNVFYGGKVPWSTLLTNYLNSIDDDKVLILLDDYMLFNVDLALLERAEALCKDGIGCINLLHYAKCNRYTLASNIEGYKTYPFDSPITIGVQATIWQKQYMLDVYQPGKSSWDSEYAGYDLMAKLGKQVLFSIATIMQYDVGGCMKKGNKEEWVWKRMVERW